jgi:RNA-directed DNA polymerase
MTMQNIAEVSPMRRQGGGVSVVVRRREDLLHGEGRQDDSIWTTERFNKLGGFSMNVKEVQRRLWEQSQLHKGHTDSGGPLFPVNQYDQRIRNLYDLMHHPQWLSAACDRVLSRSKDKAAGVDGVSVGRFKDGLDGKLESLRLELKRGTYFPQPLRRVLIPKANGKTRPLGIPCLRDKIVQEAMRMALEPIFEVEFHDNSYGFRPNRSTHHAVFRCQQLTHTGFTWVIEGDVKACFDEISHKAILSSVRKKVMDNKFLDLVARLLKAGVQVDGIVQPTVKGVPQGGIVSPLLSNAVLNQLDWFLHEKGAYGKDGKWMASRQYPNIRFVRYADDWCVFITRGSKRLAEELREQIREFLDRKCGLRLSEEKTRITHVRDGFEFLGFHISLGAGQRGKLVPKIKIPNKARTKILERLSETIRFRPHQESVSSRIIRGSSVILGWANYYRIAHNYASVASTLDHHTFWIATKTICRKFDISTAQCLRKYQLDNTIGVNDDFKLRKFSDIKRSRDFRGPKPYQPGKGLYLDDAEMDVNYQMYEKGRLDSMDLKIEALQRDGYKCRHCGVPVSFKSSQADHIRSVKCFANFSQAHTLSNIQTLCLSCHKEKTNEGL